MQSWVERINQKLHEVKDLSLGLDLGTHVLRYALVDREKKCMVQWGSLALNANPQGEAASKKNHQELRSLLKDLAKTLPKNRLGSIHTNLRGPSVVMGHFAVPPSSREEKPEQMRSALREKVPFPIEEAAYFCREYPLNGEKEKVSFNFLAVPKKVVFNTLEPIEEAFPVVPEVTSVGFAQESLLEFLELSGSEESIAFITVGKSTTVISIFQKQKLVFERHIPLAGQDFTRAILILTPKENAPRSSLDLDLAEKLKKESFIPLPKTSSKEALENEKVFRTLEGVLAAWVQDIRLSFHYFNEHYNAQKISKMYLLGGGANLKNLVSYLEQKLETPAALLTWPEKSKLAFPETSDPSAFKKQFHEYATALALALQPDGHASLTPRELSANRLEKIGHVAVRVGSALLFIFLFTQFLFLNAEIHSLRDLRSVMKNQQQFLGQVERPYLEMLGWENFLRDVDGKVLPASTIFKMVSRRIPANVLLSRFTLDRDQGTLLMEGLVYGDPKKQAITLAEFSKALTESHYFENIQIPLLGSHQGQETAGVFHLTAELVKPDQEKTQPLESAR